MDATPLPAADERVLVLAPTRADARMCARFLSEAGLVPAACADPPALVAEIRRGAAAVLLTDESLASDGASLLAQALAQQPPWSDLPILLLCGRNADPRRVAWALDVLGNVTVLERPIQVTTLVSAVRAAVRARRRQYELREADRRKDEFLATLSHELRNPLAPLRNCLHLLRQRLDDDASARSIHALMTRQVDHLVRLVDDLLELSRVTRGALTLRIERMNVAHLVASAIETSEPAIAAGGHRLDVALPPEPLYVDGDPVRLAQIVANLLNNAAKYTEPGGRITVEARRGDGAAVIVVRDNGSGISAQALPRIFDMFSRGDRAGRSDEPGLGIGLGIARRLAQMHGGTLAARSEGVGRGSEFLLRLPAAAGPEAAGPAPALDAGPALPGRILVVDDNRDAAESLRMVLELLGADVRVAYDGHEALRAFAACDPEIVLMDIGMPGMDGYETARRMRALRSQRRPHLVALTGWGQEEDRRRAADAGFDEHIVKPAEIGALRALLAAPRLQPAAGAQTGPCA